MDLAYGGRGTRTGSVDLYSLLLRHNGPGLAPKDVNRSSVIAKHVHRWFPVTVASQALTGQTIGRYTLWVLGFIENRLGNVLNANPQTMVLAAE